MSTSESQQLAAALASHKRRRNDLEGKENENPLVPQPTNALKKARNSLHSRRRSEDQEASVYTVLPNPTQRYIQLRFQLCNFRGVFRTVRVPLNYNFANLHMLIQFMFGWNNNHLHVSKVWSDVQLYSGAYKKGHIKVKGRRPSPPDLENDEETELRMKWLQSRDKNAVYEVFPQGGKRTYDDLDFDPGEKKVEDHELTLSQVWDRHVLNNASGGECMNREVAIEYEYDLGSSWHVHITMEDEDDFYLVEPASNMPVVVNAKGAPPIEDACGEVAGELEENKKKIPPMFKQEDSFALYCQGKLFTLAGKTELRIGYTLPEGDELAALKQQQKQGKDKRSCTKRDALPENEVREVYRHIERTRRGQDLAWSEVNDYFSNGGRSDEEESSSEEDVSEFYQVMTMYCLAMLVSRA